MSDVPRWSPAELSVRYSLEPGLQDCFVEGPFDVDVLSEVARAAGRSERTFYAIEAVDVPLELLRAHGLTEGNKQRVIALARDLAQLPSACLLRFVVDRDLDHWFGELDAPPRVVWTEHCSLEAYFFDDEFLRSVLLLFAKAQIEEWSVFRDSLRAILRSLYVMRLADRHLQWRMRFVSFERLLERRNSSIAFDSKEYTKRLLLDNGMGARAAEFARVVTKWESTISGDSRGYMHGHDFVRLLVWSVHRFGRFKTGPSEESIRRLFVVGCNRIAELSNLVG